MLGASRLTDRTPVFVAAMKDVSTPGPAPPTKTERDQPSLFDPNSTVGASSSSAAKTLPEEEAVNGETASSVQQQQATATEAASTAAAAASRHGRERDSSWLELEACREHLRQMCPRQADECRYAHLDQRIYVKDGRVTCCYDFLKDRCYREKCRYFHPPIHIKERLVSAGKQFGAMMSNLYTVPGAPPSTQFHNNSFSHLNGPPLPLVAPVIYSPDGRVMSAAPPGLIPNTPYGTGAERIDICPYFSQGKCNNPVCLMIHPEPHIRLNMDSTVTVCRDFVRGGCTREQCRYFHPPGGMMAHLDSGAVPAVVQQGIMVASPVVPVYPPMMYPMPGPVTTLPSPTGVPLYPSVAGVPMPVGLMPPPPTPATIPQPYNNTPISTITSSVLGPSNHNNEAPQSIIASTPVQH